MAVLKIPQNVKKGILLFSTLPDDDLEKLFNALNMKLKEKNVADIRSLDVEIPTLTDRDIKSIIDAIISTQRVLIDSDVTSTTIINDICDTLSTSSDSESTISEENCKRLNNNLQKFLDIELLSMQAKGFDLQTSNERSFCRVKIITDLRPIYKAKVEDGLQAGVILHQLRIEYHSDEDPREHKVFNVTMDKNDIKNLRFVIDRAEIKQAILEQFLESSNLINISE